MSAHPTTKKIMTICWMNLTQSLHLAQVKLKNQPKMKTDQTQSRKKMVKKNRTSVTSTKMENANMAKKGKIADLSTQKFAKNSKTMDSKDTTKKVVKPTVQNSIQMHVEILSSTRPVQEMIAGFTT